MVDVCGDDGASGGDFGADEFRVDFARDALGEAAEDGGGERIWDFRFTICDLGTARVLFAQVVADDVVGQVSEA